MFVQLLQVFSCLVLLYTNTVHASFPCYANNSYTYGSQYQINLKLLLRTLVSNGPKDGFFNTSVGDIPDIVYGLVECRGDVSMEECGNCLNSVSIEIVQGCPNGKEASYRSSLASGALCHLHYSNQRFFSKVDSTEWWGPIPSSNFVSDTDLNYFQNQLAALMNDLSSNAVSRVTRYDSGSIAYKTLSNISGLVQCTRDLSPSDCFTCLKGMISFISSCCNKSARAHIFTTSCYIRYGTDSFIEVPPQPTPSPPVPASPPQEKSPPAQPDAPKSGKGKGNSLNVILVVGGSIIASVILLASCAFCITKRIRKNRSKTDGEIINRQDDHIKSETSQQYDLNAIKTATNNFSDANKLGEGGFGAVYKGILDGKIIAVKRLSKNSGQGSQEFKNEVALLRKLQHRNLVRLLGFCLDGEEKLLIYEYLANRSLDKYIFDSTKKTCLDWKKRYKIIEGIARGLLYLHEDSRLKIIHRDLKSGNILLDDEMNAKIADFGMAKLFEIDQNHGNTSRIVGTYGYMAPEYALEGLFSVKSDVFSFGVLLLEIISGQRTRNFRRGSSGDLLSCAWNLWKEGSALRLMDPTLLNSYSANEVMKCIHIGLLCVQDNLVDRPTMSTVVFMLKSSSVALETPSAPPFMSDETSTSSLYPVDDISFGTYSSG